MTPKFLRRTRPKQERGENRSYRCTKCLYQCGLSKLFRGLYCPICKAPAEYLSKEQRYPHTAAV